MFGFGSRRPPRGYSPPHHRRNHPTIDPLNFSQDIVRQADKKCFKDNHLSQTLVAFANSPNIGNRLTPHQAAVLRAPLPNTNRGANRRAIQQFFKTWFDIFNSLFYGGSIAFMRDRIELLHGIPNEDNPLEHMNPLYKGEFRREVDRSPRDTGVFRFNLDMDVENNTVEAEYLGVLVHEMLHAFFHCHRCECWACEAVRHPSLGGYGQSHGTAWADAMLAIGQALQDQVAWKVDVGLAESVDTESRMTHWQPTPQQLSRWGTPNGNQGGVRMRSQPRRQPSAGTNSWEDIRRRREAREAQDRAARPPWQPRPQPQPPLDIPSRYPTGTSRPRSPPRNRPPEPPRRPSEPQGQSEIEAAIAASIRDVEDQQLARVLADSRRDDENRIETEDEQLARALANSQMDLESRRRDGNDNRNGGQPRPPTRPRPADPNEAATRLMIAQLQAENPPQPGDEEAANED